MMQVGGAALEAHRALGGWTRVALLTCLRESEHPLDVRELAESTGVHVNTVRFHLEVLAKAGLVSSAFEHRPRRGRPRQVWRPAAAVSSGPEERYRMLAEVLAGYLQANAHDPGRLGLEIGTVWGSQLASAPAGDQRQGLERVVDMLAKLGFGPEQVDAPDEIQIHLHSCPFLEVARGNRQLVCSAHLGLLRGALAEAGVALVATALDPLVEPSLCIAHLGAPDRSMAEMSG
ncbi:MAG: helix-turn-helix transcriptional regulator [Candidatus Dormibacteria bacterium]